MAGQTASKIEKRAAAWRKKNPYALYYPDPLFDEATQAITAGITAAREAIAAGMHPDDAYLNILVPIQLKYDDVGADDTESAGIIADAIDADRDVIFRDM